MLKFKEDIFLKNVSILFIGTVTAQLINIGGLPILSRMYGTSEFAVLAIFMAIGLIVLSFSTLQLDLATVRTTDLQERFSLMRMAFTSVFVTSIVITLLGFLFGKDWNVQIDSSFLLLLFFYLIANAGNQILVYFFNSEKKYEQIAIARIILALANLILAMVLFFWQPQLGLIVAITFANILSFIGLLLFFGEKIKAVFQIKYQALFCTFQKNIKFVKFSTPAMFLDILSFQVVIIFLSKYFSEDITGSYFMAIRIVLLPTALIGFAVGQVFYKEISDKFSNQILRILDFWKIWRILLVLGVLPFMLLFFFGVELFEFILGPDWILAGKMANILAISGFFTFLSSPTSSGFVVMNQQKYNLLNSSIRIIYTLIFLKWSVSQNDIFFFLWSYTIAEVVMMILYNLVMMWLLKSNARSEL